MGISDVFIRRPVATNLLAGAILVAGAAAFTQLPVAPLPRVDFPTVNVGVNFPGASPETMASSVATPLERRFGRIAGLAEMTSTSTLGSTSITLQFDLDRDVDSAARDVQAAINAAGGELPPNLPFRPRWQKVNPADSPVVIIALKSKSLALAQVFDAANTILAQKIAQVPGVGQVYVGGGQQPAVRVQVDPQALAGVGMGLEELRGVLSQLTTDSPKGGISSEAQSRAIRANDQLFRAREWRDAIIRYSGGSAIRLGDVARVTESVENERLAGWTRGERAVVLIIRRQPGANILEVIERVKAILPELTRSISPAIDVEVAIDRAQTIRSSVRDVEIALSISVCLVVLVCFAFLRSARATLIPSVAVPISLLGTFGVMYLVGYSIDNLSLMALTIATGFVVDDAIVVTENITRHVEHGRPPLAAAIAGARQIGFTVLSMTASLLAVFIPILLMGGIVGRLFREFAVVLAIAITVSAAISLTLTPTMCAQLLRPGGQHGAVAANGGRRGILERSFARLQGGYGAALAWVLRHRRLFGLVTVATVALTVWLYTAIPFGLFPQQDTGLVTGFSDAPQDISFPAMKARQERLNAIVLEDPDVDSMVSSIGGGGPGGSTVNTGTMFIALKPRSSRKATADQIINRLRRRLGEVEGINLFLQAAQDVRVGGRFARTQYQYTLQDGDLEELQLWAPRMLAKLRTLPELRDVASDQQTAGLLLGLTVDRDTASRLGLSMRDIDGALYDAFGQRQVATSYTQLNAYRLILEVKPDGTRGPDALSHVYAGAAGGSQVPLDAVVKAQARSTLLSLNHQGQFPSVTLSFNTAPGVALGPAVEAIHQAEREIGLPAGMHAAFSGTAQAFKDSLRTQPFLILSTLITVYIVLGMLYESFIHPITILSTLPSAGVGALLALLLFRTELSVIALIGIILLIGIVKKNAILMIDFALEAERERGLAPEAAIYEACLLRFRPILMTTMAALLGGLPLALGTGTGSELRRPLGIAIVGGLLLSQALTLFTTPVIYLALDRFRRRRGTEEAPGRRPSRTNDPGESDAPV